MVFRKLSRIIVACLFLFSSLQVSQAGNLVHFYEFEDDWEATGSIADSVGGVSGVRIGSPARVPAAASGNKPETCFAADINGGAFHLNGLAVNTGNSEINSVTFWMYWDGTEGIMPFGWQRHDLWFTSGSFGFNSASGDIYGISSSGLDNGWHHVAAVFNNGNLTANQLYIDGVQQTLTQRRNLPNNTNAIASTSATISGWRATTGYRFRGFLDEVRIYTGAVTQAQINAEVAATKTCVLPPPPPPPPPAELIHHYEFDDDWDLTGALSDSVNSVDGASVNFSSGKVRSDANGIKPDTCYAAQVNNGAFHLDGLSVSTGNGEVTSVSFWMYWDGVENVMPFGWGSHDLWFRSGSFGFNTASSDIYGIASAGLANGWHHVAAVFNNGDVAANKLYIDGVQQSLTQRQGTPNNSRAVVAASAAISGWRRDTGYRFGGSLDEVKIYRGEMSQDDINADLTAAKTVCAPPPPPVPAVLKHYYEFDDAWDISGLLSDTEGSINGTTVGSPTKVLAPESGVKPETCTAAEINQGAFHLDGLDINTATGEANSVTFWMYWDGRNSVMPFGWNTHDLWLNDGSFGFNSGNGDIYGIASSGLSNGWHHVAATFNNGRLQANKLYIDGVEQVLTQRRSSPNNSRAVAATSATISGWRRSSGYRFSGRLDEVKIYTGTVTQNQVDDDMAAKTCGSVTPYAYFRLDEFSLNGTSGEISDNMGNALAARAIGTAEGVVATDENKKVCFGVEVPASNDPDPLVAIDTGIDVDTDIGNTGTINFWYKSNESWDSGNARMLFDASKENTPGNDPYFYLLIKNDGRLRFGLEDVRDGDVRRDTDTAFSFSADEWVHIAVVWSLPLNTYKIYVNGVEQAVTNVNNTKRVNTIGALDTLYFGDNRGDYNPGATDNSANGRFDEIRIYRDIVSIAQIQTDMNATHVCSVPPPTGEPAYAFNCVEPGENELTGRLFTKVVGQSFKLDIYALENNDADPEPDAIESNFAKDADRIVKVQLVDVSGTTCEASTTVLYSQDVVFTAAEAGHKVAVDLPLDMSISNAYRTVQCRVIDETDAPVIVSGCSSDQFAVRPDVFALNIPDMAFTSETTNPKLKTGVSFNLEVTSVDGYDGTPLIVIPATQTSAIDPHIGAVATGILSGSFGAANKATGIASGSFSYSEVGNFRFRAQAIRDESFTSIDQTADCIDNSITTTPDASGRVGCDIANITDTNRVGRFTPSHFDVVVSDDGELTNSCGSAFSYSGQDIGFSSDPEIQIIARNHLADNPLTPAFDESLARNYSGNYAHLTTGGTISITLPASYPVTLLDNSTPGASSGNVSLNWDGSSSSFSTPSGSVGVFDVNLSGLVLNYDRVSNNIVVPFTPDATLDMSVQADDGDDVTGTSAVSITPADNPVNPVLVRYGRLALINAYGSELQTLPMPMQVEYFSGAGAGFVPNATDTCTVINTVVITEPPGVTQTLEVDDTCIWDPVGDSGSFNCSSAGSGADQYFATPVAADFNLNLKAPDGATTGVLNITADAPEYLEFNWTGTPGDPTATATFGIHNTDNNLIFMREVR